MNTTDIETPAVLIDEEIALRNIRAYQDYADTHGFRLRPHIKTHKLPHFATAQLAAGASGITCQKVSEAEVMADGGARDILITYNIVGAPKVARLAALARRLDWLGVVADSEAVIDGLSTGFADEARPLNVLIECDTGGRRCGVQTPEQAAGLAERVVQAPGMVFAGLMTYPAPGGGPTVQSFMEKARDLLQAKGFDCPVISSGGSPDMWKAHEVPIVSEYRVGTYIYNDRSLVARGTCAWTDCALSVLATVVSTPTPERAVIDAGSKVLTSDLLGLEGHGYLLENPQLAVTGLSEEHGVITALEGGETGLEVGDRVRIVPNHCCVVSNMMDMVYLHTGGDNLRPMAVAARGRVT